MKLPLGGISANYDSKKSRAELINLIAEGNKDGGYKCVRKCDGLTDLADFDDGPVRSTPLVNSGYAYVVSGSSLYRVNDSWAVEDLGVVGGSGRAKVLANSVPGDNQILILNGSGVGYIYTNANGLVQITDPDFFSSSSATTLDERFWLARDGTNEFFGSDLSDGTAYNPLTFGSADESPDNVVSVIQKKSALWVLGSNKIEYFQRFDDTTFPLRSVKGATIDHGILVNNTLAEMNDYFAYLADDLTVRMIAGTQSAKLSDLDFELRVKGNGTAAFPGFTTIDDAYGFFVDGPIHSIYYITFPTEGFTYGFDIKTQLSHRRESEGLGYWRVNGSAKFGTDIICGDSETGKLWKLDINSRTEDGTLIRSRIRTPSISHTANVTISAIELDMEVAQTEDPTIEPVMMVRYTKDGGNTWINKGTIPVGNFGQHSNRVVLRNFGRLVRNKDFALELETTADIGVQFYGADMKLVESI